MAVIGPFIKATSRSLQGLRPSSDLLPNSGPPQDLPDKDNIYCQYMFYKYDMRIT